MTAPGTPPTEPWPIPPGGDDGGVELFPVNFGAYRHHQDLETETQVQAIADLLAPYGLRLNTWDLPEDKRDSEAVEIRLRTWRRLSPGGGNTVLYWVGHGSARNLAHYGTPDPIDDGLSPEALARAISSRQLDPGNEGTWAIVVLDACFSHDFAKKVHSTLLDEVGDPRHYLLLSTAAEGYTELGTFTDALKRVLTVTFRGQPAIRLARLGSELAERLGGYRGDRADHRDQLVRLTPDVATAVSAPLDQLAELQAVIDQLPVDEQRHFLPKATGAELGELTWYFHGRTEQRDHILHWLTTATRGALVVTGPAGSGKSALLGHILLHTRTGLRDILIRREHLKALPAGTPCPDDPFDLAAHLAGLTLTHALRLVAHAADLPDLARQITDGQPPADVATRLVDRLRTHPTPLTLLFDALDEAEQPLVIADTLLRPLAALPTVRLIIGTRRSTREGPDQPAPADTDILDSLRPRSATPGTGPETDLEFVQVPRDPKALAGYLHAKLDTAKRRGTLDADDDRITAVVRRLVTEHQQGGAEPQQFLYVRLAAHELLNNPALLDDPSPLIGRTHRQLFTRALHRLHRTNPHYAPLLQALGLAQGRGLPDQDGIWARTADALTSGSDSAGGGIPDLTRDAAPYLVLDQQHGQAVYRLAHRTFTEQFTSAPDTAAAHSRITTALTRHARHTVTAANARDGATTPPPELSPYIRHHLAAHARLGHSAGALHTLADHPDVLDRLDLTSITTAAFGHGLPTHELPPAIAGTVLLQHEAHRATAFDQPGGSAHAWRRWWRRLGTAYIQGSSPSAEAGTGSPGEWPPSPTVWAVQRRQLHLQMTGHPGRVRALAVFTAPDGTPRLAAAGADGTVQIWNPDTGRQVGEPLTGHSGAVLAVAAFTAPDRTPRLATGGADGTVRLWNPDTGRQAGEPLTGHSGAVLAVAAFTAPDRTPRLATGGSDDTVRLWNPDTGEHIGKRLTGHNHQVNAVVVFAAPNGTPRLATASNDGTLRIWDPATGDQVGRTLSGGQVGTIPTGHQVGGALTGRSSPVLALALLEAPGGTPRLAAGDDSGEVRIWDPDTGKQVGATLASHTGRVTALAVFAAPDGTPSLATAGGDGTVRIWNPDSGKQVGVTLAGHTDRVQAVAVFAAPDGTPRLATGGDDKAVRIWNPAIQEEAGEQPTDHSGTVHTMAVLAAPDGTPRLATAGDGGMLEVWNPGTGLQVDKTLAGHSDRVQAVAVFAAPDGTPRLATGGGDDTVRIWNPVTGRQARRPLTGHTGWVLEIAAFAAPDGTPRLATVSQDRTIRIWNPNRYFRTRIGKPLPSFSSGALAVFPAPDGTPRLAAAGGDRTVRIWNPDTGQQVGAPLTGHTDWVMALAVFPAPDGTPRLATAGGDRTVRIWNPDTGRQVGEPLTGHSSAVFAITVFSAPDGTPRLATGGDDGTVRIWNPTTRTGHALPLVNSVYALTAGHGLLVAGTRKGFFAIDLSSVPTHPTSTGSPD
ncbi:AAA family ATPase [Kitasatospora sp. NPDC057692]|uniref:AAA family ATPase n=1 Tax=Kitasatospora sp. NPDC057692 TaxID=3346215 RepID=UPI0036AAF4ED